MKPIKVSDNFATLTPGTRILAIKGETSSNDKDEVISTGPMAEGVIDEVLSGQAECFSVRFKGGIRVLLSVSDLTGPTSQYQILPGFGAAIEVVEKSISNTDVKLFRAVNGVPFICRPRLEGDSYGLNLMLIYKGEPVVEYYDARYAHTDFGQFISGYCLSTLTDHVDQGRGGLNLHGGEPDWTLDEESFVESFRWAKERIAARLLEDVR